MKWDKAEALMEQGKILKLGATGICEYRLVNVVVGKKRLEYRRTKHWAASKLTYNDFRNGEWELSDEWHQTSLDHAMRNLRQGLPIRANGVVFQKLEEEVKSCASGIWSLNSRGLVLALLLPDARWEVKINDIIGKTR